jgi:hypothetical protein
LRLKAGQVVAARDPADRLLRRAGREGGDDFIMHQPRLVAWRNVDGVVAASAGPARTATAGDATGTNTGDWMVPRRPALIAPDPRATTTSTTDRAPADKSAGA